MDLENIDFVGQLRMVDEAGPDDGPDELTRVGIRSGATVVWSCPNPYEDLFASRSVQVDQACTTSRMFRESYGMYRLYKTAYELGASTALLLTGDAEFLRDVRAIDEAAGHLPSGFYFGVLTEGRYAGRYGRETNGWVECNRADIRDVAAVVWSRSGLRWIIGWYERSADPDPFKRMEFRTASTWMMPIFYRDPTDKSDPWTECRTWVSKTPLVANRTKLAGSVSVDPRVVDVSRKEALDNSLGFSSRPVVPVDTIKSRMAACLSCPMHERRWCPTCAHAAGAVSEAFGSDRRPVLPDEDRKSGVCRAHRAYELAVASVDFGSDPVPGDCPASCWRRCPSEGQNGIIPAS